MTAALQAPETPRSAIKCVAMLLDKNLLDGQETTILAEPSGNFAYHRALIVAKDIQAVTTAPRIAFWAGSVPMTSDVTLDAFNADNEAVELPPYALLGVNQAVPLMLDGEPVKLINANIGAADAFVVDIFVYGAEVELT